jgi:hypothetical protein
MKSPARQGEARKGNDRRLLHPLADMALFEMRGI